MAKTLLNGEATAGRMVARVDVNGALVLIDVPSSASDVFLAALPGGTTRAQVYSAGTDNCFGLGNLIDTWNGAGAMTRIESPADAVAAARDAFKAACLAAAN